MTHRGPTSLGEAIEWLRAHWQPRSVPLRLHDRASGIDGEPRLSGPFLRFLVARPNDQLALVETRLCSHPRLVGANAWECPDCQGLGVCSSRTWRYENPMWRALARLFVYDRSSRGRFGREISRTAVILDLVAHRFTVPPFITEEIAVEAIRALFQRYEVSPAQV